MEDDAICGGWGLPRDIDGRRVEEKLEGAPGTVASDITTIKMTEATLQNKRN